jgi:DivIVA domain-containing protein
MYEDQDTHQTQPVSGETAEFQLSRGPTSILDELRDTEFPFARRGYDRDVVDAYIDRVAVVVEDLVATRSPQFAVNRALQDLGAETAGILREAQDTARQMTDRAREQARERVEEATREAENQRTEAAAFVRRLDEDADRIWEERQRLIDNARSLAKDLVKLADDAEERFPAERPQPSDALAEGQDAEEQSSEDTDHIEAQPVWSVQR